MATLFKSMPIDGNSSNTLVEPLTGPFSEWKELFSLAQGYSQKFSNLFKDLLEQNEIAGVHKIRATSRKLEQILPLIYSNQLPDHVYDFCKKIRRCRHLLSELADYQMILTRAKKALLQDPACNPIEWHAIATFIEGRRDSLLPRILQKLERLDHASHAARLQRDLEENWPYVHFDGKFRSVNPHKARQILEERMEQSLSKIWGRFESVVRRSSQDPSLLHGVRIATKHLRNLVEIMSKIGISGSDKTLGWVYSIQKTTGDWRDLQVLERLTRELLLQKKFLRDRLELAIQIEMLLLKNRQIKKKAEEKFHRMTGPAGNYEKIEQWVSSIAAPVYR